MTEITTVEELDALPVGSVVLDAIGDAWQRGDSDDHWWCPANPFLSECPAEDVLEVGEGGARLLYRPNTPAPPVEDRADDGVWAANLQAFIDEMHAEPIRRAVADDLDPAAVERARDRIAAYLDEMDRVDAANRAGSRYDDTVHGINDLELRRSDIRAALAAAGPLVTPEQEQPATPLSDLIESARRWHDPEADTEGPAVSVADLVAALPEHDAQVAARALRKAAEVIDGAEVYDELAAPNLDGVRWTEECVHGAVAESGPITDWLRRRADRIERQEGGR